MPFESEERDEFMYYACGCIEEDGIVVEFCEEHRRD